MIVKIKFHVKWQKIRHKDSRGVNIGVPRERKNIISERAKNDFWIDVLNPAWSVAANLLVRTFQTPFFSSSWARIYFGWSGPDDFCPAVVTTFGSCMGSIQDLIFSDICVAFSALV